MAAGKGLQAGLPAEVLEASYEPGALKYLTRGLTSNIYSLRLSPSDLPLSDKLRKLQASPGTIVVKAVDTEDEARPHSVLKELLILQRLSSSNQPPGHQYILSLLDTSEDCPDDFTTIRRLYFPHYAGNFSEWLVAEATLVANTRGASSFSYEQRISAGLRLAQQLFPALDFLHSQNIYHRDIKPANLLLTSLDPLASDFEMRLCDFGTAWWTGDEHVIKRPTTCSTSTHPYTPPELLFSPSNGYEGSKADVWEAACVLAELFTPFERAGLDPEDVDPLGDAFSFNAAKTNEPLVERQCLFQHESSKHLPSKRKGAMLFGESDGSHDEDEDEEAFWRAEEKSLFGNDLFGKQSDRNSGSKAAHLESSGFNGRHTDPPQPFGPSSHVTRQYTHSSLFRGNQGDLGLASDIFDLLGLPEAGQGTTEWPESLLFRPPLDRFPFPRRPAPDIVLELRARLPLLYDSGNHDEDSNETQATVEAIQDVLTHCWRLSANERWTSRQILSRLEETSPIRHNLR